MAERLAKRCFEDVFFFFFLFGMKFNVECQINIFLIESWWVRIFSILNYESFFLFINYRSVFFKYDHRRKIKVFFNLFVAIAHQHVFQQWHV